MHMLNKLLLNAVARSREREEERAEIVGGRTTFEDCHPITPYHELLQQCLR